MVQQSGDFIDCVIFESYKNGIGDLTKASGYKLELCSISSVCEGDEVSGAGSGALSAYLRIDPSLKFFYSNRCRKEPGQDGLCF